MSLAVHERSPEVEEMARDWPMLGALMGGTRAMRDMREDLLPKRERETKADYAARLAVSTLWPAYMRTVGVMAGKPFAKPLVLADADPRIEASAQDIDLQGVNLHSFAAEMFAQPIAYGLAGILVEYPRTAPQTRTVAEVERAGLRPYWVRVKHNQILGWKSANIGGSVKLTQLRLLETYDEDDGPFGVKVIAQVRVLFPGGWQIYRASTGNRSAWSLVEEGVTTLKEIPFVPLYGLREAFMIGRAPMLDLAYLNVKHWQSQSRQDDIVDVARVPFLTVIGPDTQYNEAGDALPFEIVAGVSSATVLPRDGDMKFVEHSGGSIESGRQSLIDLRDQMVTTGAELLVKRESGDVSATEAGNDAEANKSTLQRIAETFSDALDQALVYTAQYAGIDPARAGTVQLYSDYGAATLSDATAQLVVDLNSRGILSNETTIREMQRRGVISEDIVPADELEAAKADGPKLGELGAGDEGGAA